MNPKRGDVPETVTDRNWDRITRAAAAAEPSPMDPGTSARQDSWNAAAANAGWN